MFGFLKRKAREVKSPIDGMIVPIEEVDDEVFSAKMAGDGIAIIPVGDTFVAPIDGKITKIFSTNHAFSIRNRQDLEVLVHIGLETVALKGEGFERLAQEGDEVTAGTPVIKVDLAYIKAHAKDIVTPVLISTESKAGDIEKRTGAVKSADVVMAVR